MAHIKTIPENEAQGEVAEVYKRLVDSSGKVANILKAESLAPKALAAHYAYYRELMFGVSPLTRAQRELLAVAVSQANRCEY